MANRNFANGGKIYSMNVKPVSVDCRITIGGTGAVSSFSSSMVSSVTRQAQGIYKINLSSNFYTMLQAQGSMQSPVSGLSGILAIEIQNAPAAAVSNLAAPSLIVKTLDAAGALADPASGSVIAVVALMNDSSVVA